MLLFILFAIILVGLVISLAMAVVAVFTVFGIGFIVLLFVLSYLDGLVLATYDEFVQGPMEDRRALKMVREDAER